MPQHSDTVTVEVLLGADLLRRLDAVASDLGMDRPEAIHTARGVRRARVRVEALDLPTPGQNERRWRRGHRRQGRRGWWGSRLGHPFISNITSFMLR